MWKGVLKFMVCHRNWLGHHYIKCKRILNEVVSLQCALDNSSKGHTQSGIDIFIYMCRRVNLCIHFSRTLCHLILLVLIVGCHFTVGLSTWHRKSSTPYYIIFYHYIQHTTKTKNCSYFNYLSIRNRYIGSSNEARGCVQLTCYSLLRQTNHC